ncbi:MAG: tetratricopeptide repeat protein [Planctomycetota bacterium]|nr:MAG: tetratricopeptide repeat protein [Planctomycetota bacterium]
MTIEAIAWVGERKTLLATFFALWSLLLYVRYRRTNGWGSYAVCLVMYVLALMSKPTSTPLPVLFLLIDYWPIRQLNWKSVIEKIPFFVIAGISAYITIGSQREAAVISVPTQYAPLHVPLTLCHNIIFYLYKIVLPINLTSHYPFPDPFTPSNSMVLAGIIGTSLLIPILIISLWWTRALLTGWLIFFVAIFPSMGVIGFTNVIASNKFAYLPSIGLLMILVWLVGRFWHVPDITTRRAGIRAALIGMTLALVASEAVATRRHLEYWQDTEGLFRYMLNITPDAAAPHFSLATVLSGLDKTDEAIEHYNQALRITPNHLDAHYNLANALIKKRDIDGAIKHYREALRIDPNFALAHSNIGSAMFEKGDTEKAIQHLTRALELNPKSYRAHYNLGNALLRQNRTDEAIQHYTRAIELNPNFIAGYKQLGSVLSKQGELAKAIRIYQAVIQHQPNNAQTHFDLGILFGRLGYIDAAIGEFNRTLQINPNHIGAQKALAVALAEKKRLSP